MEQTSRRRFLKEIAVVAGAAPLAAGAMSASAATDTPSPSEPADPPNAATPSVARAEVGYESLSPDEADFVEAMVNVMCPADELTPNGVDCGLSIFIDRQLAGGYGKGEKLYMRGPWRQGKPQLGYQLALTPEQFFKAGIAAANAVCLLQHGKVFSALAETDADAFLHDLAGGKVTDPRLPLGSWFNELVYPLFTQACFADPIYGGNVGKVFWKMVGYPGLPATHAQDMAEFRGKPYPGATEPKAISDFS